MKRLLLTLTIVCLSVLFINSFAYAEFERSLHNKLDIETPSIHNMELGFIVDFASGQVYSQNNNIDITIVDFYAKYGLAENWELGIDAPYKNWSTDKAIVLPNLGLSDKENGITDINIWTKYRFSKEAEKKIGAAGGINLKLKNGDADKGLGTGKYEVMPFLMATYKYREPIIFGAKLGYNIVGEPMGVKWDNEMFYSAWARYTMSDQLGIVGEVNGNTLRAGNGAGKRADALEVDGGITYGFSSNVGLVAGAGIGLTDNAPNWRFFVAVKSEFITQ